MRPVLTESGQGFQPASAEEIRQIAAVIRQKEAEYDRQMKRLHSFPNKCLRLCRNLWTQI